ncbi:ADP-ribose pyrophosphatase [Haloactinopolyspora alba]|uniref:ADP-ribose pyrophosphatase n=1 Tax=Haloactinopolyspora alba TaxID=648780 RepID=A0A2P8E260_9ACTN|nr:NUDIX hydrolase [Haloactinopolyspora alba]PSL03539.1 ADP-ribose pyrophosphatase [Haloactinopolyspora alba]
MSESLADQPESWPVTASDTGFTGGVVSVRSDTIRSPVDDGEFVRDVVEHPGAVAVVALDDDARVLVVRQYRHPVRLRPVELPAGLRDVDDEPPRLTAERELYEEGHVRARDWNVLVDLLPSPGMTDEAIRVFLARGITALPEDERYSGHHEEADLDVDWVALPELVEAVLAGRVQNATLCAGVLAAWAVHVGGPAERGYGELRPADAPWASGARSGD